MKLLGWESTFSEQVIITINHVGTLLFPIGQKELVMAKDCPPPPNMRKHMHTHTSCIIIIIIIRAFGLDLCFYCCFNTLYTTTFLHAPCFPCPGHPNLVKVVDENLPLDGDDQFGLVFHFLSLSYPSYISKNHSELKLFSTVVHSLPSVFNYWVADRSFRKENLVPGSWLKGRGRFGRALPNRSVWSGGTCYNPEWEQR